MTAELAALAARAAAADGVAPLGESVFHDLDRGGFSAFAAITSGSAWHLVPEPDLAAGDELIGYAHLSWSRGNAELVVDPAHRRAGIGGSLLASVLAMKPDAQLWAHGTLPAASALARSTGMSAVRELHRMVAQIQDRPGTGTLGVTITPYRPGRDDATLLALNARAFATHPEQGRLDPTGLRLIMAEPWFDANDLVFATVDGVPVGFCWLKVSSAAELYVLGVDPSAHGRGIGTALLDWALNSFAQRGITEAELYVDGDNPAALALYRRRGFTDATIDTQYVSYTSLR